MHIFLVIESKHEALKKQRYIILTLSDKQSLKCPQKIDLTYAEEYSNNISNYASYAIS